MEVIVEFEPDAANDLSTGATSSADTARLREMLTHLGITLRPQHPGVRDPRLSRYFVAEVRDASESERVTATLRTLRVVTGAYPKPQAETPP